MSNLFDATNAPLTEPTRIQAGDFVQWKRTDLGTDYPPASYSLQYQARSAASTARKITINASADGSDYLVTIASATTLAWDPAVYHWSAYIIRTSDSARIEIASGQWEVFADKTTSAADPRGFAQRMVDLIEAAYEHRATQQQLDVLSYNLGIDASATRNPAELLKHRAYWRGEVIKENRRARARKGQSHSGTIKVRL